MTIIVSFMKNWQMQRNGDNMKILIVSGGSIQKDYLVDYLKDKTYDHIIAADAGLAHCRGLSLTPTEILGDFDSLKNREILEEYRAKKVPVLTFPTRKDFTDTHLAVLHSIDLLTKQWDDHDEESVSKRKNSEPRDRVTIIGATGTRMDHGMANVGLLTQFADSGVIGEIIDKQNTITMLKGPEIRDFYKTEDRPFISLLACSKETSGITLEGFDYPLKNAVMHAFDSLGVSNEIIENKGVVSLDRGYLLVIQAQD